MGVSVRLMRRCRAPYCNFLYVQCPRPFLEFPDNILFHPILSLSDLGSRGVVVVADALLQF